MKVGYTKIGRSQGYDPRKWGPLGADNEAPMLLGRLARRYPEVEFVLLGHNDGADPQEIGLPANVTNPFPDLKADVRRAEQHINVKGTPPPENSLAFIRDMTAIYRDLYYECDHIVTWIGQNDTINQPIPKIDGSEGLGSSRMIYIRNCSYHFALFNELRTHRGPNNWEPIWLCSDVWNVLKARDLMWPYRHPVLCQYDFSKTMKHWRYADPSGPEVYGMDDIARWDTKTPGCWTSKLNHVYSGLELGCSVPANIEYRDNWEERARFGVIINQSRAISGRNEVLARWIRPLFPDWVYGSWDEARAPDIKPYPWHGVPDLLSTVKCGLAVPIRRDYSWATPKAWEMFAAGTVCFFHPGYDTQGHILPTLAQCETMDPNDVTVQLARWLRVQTPADLRKRVDHLHANREAWEWLSKAQRALYNVTREENTCLNMIGHRLGLESPARWVA